MSYLPRPCSGPAAAAGGGAAAAHRRRPVPVPQGPTGTADPPSPQNNRIQTRSDPIPDPFPRQAKADQTYRSLVTERQLGSRSAGRARLIRATNRVFVEKMTEGENPSPRLELFKMDASKKSSKRRKTGGKEGRGSPLPALLRHPSIPTLLRLFLPLSPPTEERGAATSEAGRGALRGGLVTAEGSVGRLEWGSRNTHTHRAGKS